MYVGRKEIQCQVFFFLFRLGLCVELSATAHCISGVTEAQLGSILKIKSCPRLFEQEWCVILYKCFEL